MHSIKKYGLVFAAVTAGLISICSAANLTTNLTWCTTHSGSINVSYNECRSLAFLYNETSGDSWNVSGGWFSGTDMTLWFGSGGAGSTGAMGLSGGHVVSLNLYGNNLQNSIYSGIAGLTYLKDLALGFNSLTSINTSGLSSLRYVSLLYNFNLDFDFSHSTGITYLDLTNMNLDTPTLTNKLSPLHNIDTLIVSLNNLTGLDLSGFPLLTSLSATSIRTLSGVDLSSNPLLSGLDLSDDNLTGIDLSHNPLLTLVNLNNNYLHSVDLTHNTGIVVFAINGNSVSTIDLSTNPNLQEVYISNNNLTTLNLNGLVNIYSLSVDNNALTNLDVSDNTGLVFLNISNQTGSGIPSLDISHLLSLVTITADNAGLQSLITAPLADYPYLGTGGASFAGNHLTALSDAATLSFLNTIVPGWDGAQLELPHLIITFGGGGGGSFTHGTIVSLSTPTKITSPIILTGSTLTLVHTPALTRSLSTYEWAHSHGLTTLPLAKARLSDTIQRYEAAKMIVNYVQNIEGKTIEHRAACDISLYGDYSTFDQEMKGYIQHICDLGIMGRTTPTSKGLTPVFRPFDTLGVDEFNIIINRYLANQPHDIATSNKRVDIMKFLMQQAEKDIH